MTAPRRLLIRLGSLGDVVLATAAANAARARWGDRCLDVLVKEEWAPLWENHPAVERILAWERADRDLGGLRKWGSRLREARYLEAVDLQGTPRTRTLLTLAGVVRVRRARRRELSRRLLVRTKRLGPPPDFRMADAFVEAAVPGAHAVPSLHPGAAARARAAELAGPAAVGLVPGATRATKRWPLDRFVAVGKDLAARGLGPVAVFFGPGEDALAAGWRERWPGGGWIEVRAGLPTVAAILGRLGAVATGDTGLMHVAAAVGTPVVALFGPTVRSFGFAPAGEGHRVVERDLPCRPCSLHGGPRCPLGHFRCLLEIEPDEVLAALRTALDARGASAGPS